MNSGLEFEKTLARAWVLSGIKLVRMKFTEAGEQRPCDERIDFENWRVFNELKTTTKKYFDVKQLKQHQLKSLALWHKKFENSIGLVTIEYSMFNTLVFISITDFIKLISENNYTKLCLLDFSGYTHKKYEKVDGEYRITEEILKMFERIKPCK